MSAALRGAVKLGGGSTVAIVAGVALGKIQAVTLGPAGVGRLSLLQTIVVITMIPASLGMSQALTRIGGIDAVEGGTVFAAARRAAARVRAVCGAVCLLVIILIAGPICTRLLGGQVAVWELALTSLAIAASLVVAHDIAILSTALRLNSLGWFTVTDALGGAAAAAALLALLGRNGVAPSILGGTLVALALSRRSVRHSIGHTHRAEHEGSPVRDLLCVGAPYTVASAVGSAVTFSIPMIALHLLSAKAVGYYQVSQMVATGYLGFLAVAMAQDYFPRLSGAPTAAVDQIINQQQRVVILASLPVILVTVCAAPVILRIAFSQEFAPAEKVLRWQVLADTLRFSSWALAYAILARLPMRWYIGVEAVGGIGLFMATLVCVRLWGIEGLGIAPLLSYSVYYAVVALLVAKKLGFSYSTTNRRLFTLAMITTVMCAGLIAHGSWLAGEAAPAVLAVGWGAWSVRELLPEVRTRMQRGQTERETALATP